MIFLSPTLGLGSFFGEERSMNSPMKRVDFVSK